MCMNRERRTCVYIVPNLVKKCYAPVVIVDESVLKIVVTGCGEYAIKLADFLSQKLKLKYEVNDT